MRILCLVLSGVVPIAAAASGEATCFNRAPTAVADEFIRECRDTPDRSCLEKRLRSTARGECWAEGVFLESFSADRQRINVRFLYWMLSRAYRVEFRFSLDPETGRLGTENETWRRELCDADARLEKLGPCPTATDIDLHFAQGHHYSVGGPTSLSGLLQMLHLGSFEALPGTCKVGPTRTYRVLATMCSESVRRQYLFFDEQGRMTGQARGPVSARPPIEGLPGPVILDEEDAAVFRAVLSNLEQEGHAARHLVFETTLADWDHNGWLDWTIGRNDEGAAIPQQLVARLHERNRARHRLPVFSTEKPLVLISSEEYAPHPEHGFPTVPSRAERKACKGCGPVVVFSLPAFSESADQALVYGVAYWEALFARGDLFHLVKSFDGSWTIERRINVYRE